MSGWLNEITRWIRTETACQHRLAQVTVARANKGDGEWFITAGLPGLTHSVQPDSWLNKQGRNYSCSAGLHSDTWGKKAGAQRVVLFFSHWLLRFAEAENKVWEYQRENKCTHSADRQITVLQRAALKYWSGKGGGMNDNSRREKAAALSVRTVHISCLY